MNIIKLINDFYKWIHEIFMLYIHEMRKFVRHV